MFTLCLYDRMGLCYVCVPVEGCPSSFNFLQLHFSSKFHNYVTIYFGLVSDFQLKNLFLEVLLVLDALDIYFY